MVKQSLIIGLTAYPAFYWLSIFIEVILNAELGQYQILAEYMATTQTGGLTFFYL